MGKKKGGKSKGYISSGINSNVKSSTLRAMKKGYMQSAERAINEVRAYAKGKRVMVTIKNPNPAETNRLFIRVPASQVYKNRPLYRYPGNPEKGKAK